MAWCVCLMVAHAVPVHRCAELVASLSRTAPSAGFVHEHWERFDGSLCEFLTKLALGRFDASRFKDDYQWQGQERINIRSRPVFHERRV